MQASIKSIFLPWIELVSGVCLVAGIRVRASAAVICTLLGTFSIALTIVLLKKTPIDCGCFQNVGDPVSWVTLFRDLIWLARGLYVFCYDSLIHLDRLLMIRRIWIPHVEITYEYSIFTSDFLGSYKVRRPFHRSMHNP